MNSPMNLSLNTNHFPSTEYKIGLSSADGVPYDGAAREKLHHNSLALVSIYSVAAITGITFAVVCLAFNIIFRNRR
jgi:hypothetical protein